jgi:hypothetical protein
VDRPSRDEECVVGLDEPTRWRQLLDGLPHGFAHTWESCYAHSLTTGHPTFLYHGEADGARVACPIAERPADGSADVVTPPGFSGFVGSGPCPSFPALWEAFAHKRGYVCGYVALNPLFGHPTYTDPTDVHPVNDVYVLDLTLGERELHRRLSRNRRRELRDWRGDTLEDDRDRLTEFLLSHYHTFMRAHDFGRQFDFSRSTLEAICRADNVFLLGAVAGGQLEAVRVVGYTPHGADDLFMVSVGGGVRHNTGLIWSAVHRLLDMGVPAYNLGAGVRPGDEIARSKERWGAARLPLNAVKQVYDPARYELLCRQRGKDPGDRTGYFPAYRA